MTATKERSRIHVVVTCANRKGRPVPPDHQLRRIRSIRVSTRLRDWSRRLAGDTAESMPARDLYKGDHWSIANRLPAHAGSQQIILWICSAGYGLIPAEAPIQPYSATFSPGHLDTVPGDLEEWWAALADWEGPCGGPRSLSQVATSEDNARFLIVLSSAYLAACRVDVARAAESLGDPARLSIVSAGTRNDSLVGDYLLPVDARLQAALGGARTSLNVRVADFLLAAGLADHEEMCSRLRGLVSDQGPVAGLSRRRMSDSEVRDFIRSELQRAPLDSKTSLLRGLRKSGRACEQARFAAAFQRVRGET